ncbi:MAG: hypothetical protein ACXAEL_14815, partial [Candidatus Hodarchaeales archaeon]
MGTLKTMPEFSFRLKSIAKELQRIQGDAGIYRQELLGSHKELEAIKGYKAHMEAVFKCPVAVYIADSDDYLDPLNRAPRAQPTK